MHDSAREIQAFFHSSQKRAQIALTLLALQTAVNTNDLKKKIYTTNAILAQKVFRSPTSRKSRPDAPNLSENTVHADII